MKKLILLILTLSGMIAAVAFNANGEGAKTGLGKGDDIVNEKPSKSSDSLELATLAGGCFWCLESEFRALDGVVFTESGYIGGHVNNPSYRDVTSGESGHAEAVEIYFNPEKITYETLVTYFLEKAHDPTTLNRQGVDTGTQYRSEIFYHNDDQKQVAESVVSEVNTKKIHSDPIVTKITAAQQFWEAEEYHQQYYEKYEAENGRPHVRMLYKLRKKEQMK